MISRTPQFLMANLGSEISRLLDWKEKGEKALAKKSLTHSLRILDQIGRFPEMQRRAGELLQLRAVIEDIVSDVHKYSVTRDDIQDYFFPFALRTMRTFPHSAEC